METIDRPPNWSLFLPKILVVGAVRRQDLFEDEEVAIPEEEEALKCQLDLAGIRVFRDQCNEGYLAKAAS